jgi:hypothetical protein
MNTLLNELRQTFNQRRVIMKGEAKNIDAEEESRRRDIAEKIGKEDFIQRISLSGHQQTHPGALQEIDARPHVPWPAQQVNPLAHRKKAQSIHSERLTRSTVPSSHRKLCDKAP